MVSNKESLSTSREDWIDALRALAICLVVFGHQYRGHLEFFVFTSPIKMPMFFILSGYLFSPKGYNTNTFLNNILYRLFIPWVFFGLFFAVIEVPLKGFNNLLETFLNLVSGKILWFMPAFIIGQIIFYLITKYAKNEILISILCITFSVFGLYASFMHILRFAMIDVALTTQIFFLMGFLLKRHQTLLSLNLRESVCIFIGYLVLCGASLIVWPGQSIDVHIGRYYNYMFCFFIILIGCISIMNLSKTIHKYPSFITKVGQNTLLIYILHSYMIIPVTKLFVHYSLSTKGDVIFAITATVISVTLCTILSILTSKYAPLLNGTRKSK